MKVWPLRFRDVGDTLLFSNDAGDWFTSTPEFLNRYGTDRLSPADAKFLEATGCAYEHEGDLSHTAFAWKWATRQSLARPLAYVILVPTLRCNLACGYCQVSRAAESARGFDWSEDTLEDVCSFLDGLDTDSVKIEFQGGEPLLRVDILEQVRTFCRKRFREPTFVVCTNLQSLGAREWEFLNAEDTFISTSIDGDRATHKRQRTVTDDKTERFFGNVSEAVRRFGTSRISALPTIDPFSPPSPDALIDSYERLGISSIYLRPINHQGFARRRPERSEELALWNAFHGNFIERLIARNHATGNYLEEYYFSHCLKRVLTSGLEGHVDIRNPNLFGTDYVVIDYNGKIYPTDEARMLDRIGQIDLSVGHVREGLDLAKRDELNSSSLNSFDPDCVHCAYQPFCGSDLVDDISRYGRIDLPRHGTWFCGRHLALFDKVFELLNRDDEPTRCSLACWAGIENWPVNLRLFHE